MLKDAESVKLRNAEGFIDSENPLPVSATLEVGDIEIGAVEIKNHDTEDRVEVDTNNAMKTKLSVGGTDVSSSDPLPVYRLNTLVTEAYDYIALTYVAAGNGVGKIETATYKTGGAGGTTVGVLTLTYDANNKISTVTKS